VAWSGAGLSVPRRLLSQRAVRLAVRRLLGEERFRARAREIATWSEAHNGAAAAAELVEEAARGSHTGTTASTISLPAVDPAAGGPR
jgi:UDP:flavonoid glycosyltransferase YjiC (YdhE family)